MIMKENALISLVEYPSSRPNVWLLRIILKEMTTGYFVHQQMMAILKIHYQKIRSVIKEWVNWNAGKTRHNIFCHGNDKLKLIRQLRLSNYRFNSHKTNMVYELKAVCCTDFGGACKSANPVNGRTLNFYISMIRLGVQLT